MELSEVILRLGLVFVLTFIYGLQRQRSHKPIGFGTFMLVALGACGLSIVAEEIGIPSSLPLLGAIITGIGFLGAGALIRTSDKIFGFTTAASIWFFAIFGVIIGIGSYLNGLIIYSLAWIIVIVDKYLEFKGIGSYRKKITIICNKKINKEELTKLLSKHCTRFNLLNLNLNKKEKRFLSAYLIEGPKRDIEFLIQDFYKKNWCFQISLE
ncbi:MgtC/SapB family protein [Candidatus Pacearchaeota archaeon]|nr:MgtC/SapB family protein [Candidatus Pacearchaeota archaeon]